MAQHRGFQDEFYHDEKIIDTWNSVVHRKDLTYICGDITMETSIHYPQLDRLNGRKIVVLGNHDMPKDTRKLLNHVETVAGMIDWKGYVLTHAPIHPNEIGFCRGNIHAHIHHENSLFEVVTWDRYTDPESTLRPTLSKYHNVDAHLLNYKPLTIEQLTAIKL